MDSAATSLFGAYTLIYAGIATNNHEKLLNEKNQLKRLKDEQTMIRQSEAFSKEVSKMVMTDIIDNIKNVAYSVIVDQKHPN